MAQHNDFGRKGEQLAAEHLQKNGHNILALNYRHAKAEVDIISKDGNTIVFTEVKTRRTNYFGYPEESVSNKKKQLMKQAAEEYLFQNKLDADVRFDIVSIVENKDGRTIYHIKDAFFFDGMNEI